MQIFGYTITPQEMQSFAIAAGIVGVLWVINTLRGNDDSGTSIDTDLGDGD